MGRIFYIMGKSATGKDHIYRDLKADPALSLLPLILYTTRPMRQGEEDGREYHFTDEAHLEELRSAGKIIEERVYRTVQGPWYYFTADDGRIDPEKNYIGIGTLESYTALVRYYGQERIVPLYIETEDGLRLEHALKREKKQDPPQYEEMCRRFLADNRDFSEEKIRQAGITHRFINDRTLEECIAEVKEFILREVGR